MKSLMHTRGYGRGVALFLGGACLTAIACGSDSDPVEPSVEPPDSGREDGPGSFLNDATPDTVDAAPECPKCSSDLHNVLDCTGKVVKTCPDDQGCDPVSSDCVTACDSARANRSTVGCEYYGVQPDGSQQDPSLGYINNLACYAVFIANTWPTPIALTVDQGGAPFDLSTFARIPAGKGQSTTYAPLVDGKLPAGQVAILFLSDGPDTRCPEGITPPATGLMTVGTSLGTAFHITSDHPAVAYDIFPYGGGQTFLTSASLLLPTSAWDDNYMAVDPYYTSRLELMPLATQLVAKEDGTTITIVPTLDVPAGTGVAAAPKNVATTYPLAKGQVLGLSNLKGLTGSVIRANKPIGMWTSSGCINIDEWTMSCDSSHQQIPPIKSLGNEYAAVRYRNRVDDHPDEAPPWRIMAIVDDTTLTYDPIAPDGAPLSLKAGELVTFSAAGPFVVRSQDDQHPIYLSGSMTGGEIGWSPTTGYAGDPESVNVIPARQFLSSYVFFTDPTYPETNLVFVRTRAKDGTFKDVTLDCAGTLTGWQPIGSGADYEYTRLDLVRHNFAPQNGCDNGRHEVKSDAPFGLTIWGWGTAETGDDFYSEFVSYAYPAGASVRPINDVVAKPVPK